MCHIQSQNFPRLSGRFNGQSSSVGVREHTRVSGRFNGQSLSEEFDLSKTPSGNWTKGTKWMHTG
ncbi:unnamed protein product [Rhodiola kirilowii]